MIEIIEMVENTHNTLITINYKRTVINRLCGGTSRAQGRSGGDRGHRFDRKGVYPGEAAMLDRAVRFNRSLLYGVGKRASLRNQSEKEGQKGRAKGVRAGKSRGSKRGG